MPQTKASKAIQAKVKAGAAFLDVVKPGWTKKINLDELDLTGTYTCVLGEIYGDYGKGLTSLGLIAGTEIPDNLGFHSTSSVQYTRLTRAWKAFIRKLRR